MKKAFLGILVAIIIVAGGSFYAGMKYSQSKIPQRFNRDGAPNSIPRDGFQAGRGGNRMGAGFVSGDIISKDDKSITVQLRDGGSKIVFYSEATEVVKSVNGTASDIEIGKTITANGKANEDGSITAQSIQIRQGTAKPLRP